MGLVVFIQNCPKTSKLAIKDYCMLDSVISINYLFSALKAQNRFIL